MDNTVNSALYPMLLSADIENGWSHRNENGPGHNYTTNVYAPAAMSGDNIRAFWEILTPKNAPGSLTGIIATSLADHANTPTDVLHELVNIVRKPGKISYSFIIADVINNHPNLTTDDAHYIQQQMIMWAALN